MATFLQSLPSAINGLPYSVQLIFIGLLGLSIYTICDAPLLNFPFPLINHCNTNWTYRRAKQLFRSDARRLVIDGSTQLQGPFGIVTDDGPILVLSPDYIEPINQEPHLSLAVLAENAFLADYETFKSFRDSPPGLLQDSVLTGLTRSLPKQVRPLSVQMADCLDTSWGQSTDWHKIDLQTDALSWVARLSARVFHGRALSDNSEWLRLSVDYTVNVINGVGACKAFPRPLRWLAERLLPVCRKIRADYKKAAKILLAVSAERQAEITSATEEQRKAVLPDDSFEWIRNAAKGLAHSEVDVQLRLSAVAIHTSSDLLQQAVLNLCVRPELVEPLREELTSVLEEAGWTKAALMDLNLMDSFLKETQRMKPIGTTFMHRIATADVTLPNNIKIRRGHKISISSNRMWSPHVYEEPERFDAYRFRKLRESSGLGAKGLLVSTSKEHTAFGHGKHACPGRFFAAMEVKVALAHLLLKYDIRLEEPAMAQPRSFGFSMSANGDARLSVKRRTGVTKWEAILQCTDS